VIAILGAFGLPPAVAAPADLAGWGAARCGMTTVELEALKAAVTRELLERTEPQP